MLETAGGLLVMNSTIDIDIFKKRLAQTIAWCSSRVVAEEPVTCLRSFDLRPPGTWVASLLNLQWDTIVDAIALERERRLHYPGKLPVGLSDGRLLIASGITEGVGDGASEAESLGFVAEDDLPAWDTWLCYLREDSLNQSFPDHLSRYEYLASWVPPEFLELAQGAIEVQCVGCLSWAKNVDTAFTRQLKTAGLLE